MGRPGDLAEETWLERTDDLSPYAGRWVTLCIGVKNDGDEANAVMNEDDMGLQ